jgi:hypothetical protein
MFDGRTDENERESGETGESHECTPRATDNARPALFKLEKGEGVGMRRCVVERNEVAAYGS